MFDYNSDERLIDGFNLDKIENYAKAPKRLGNEFSPVISLNKSFRYSSSARLVPFGISANFDSLLIIL